MVVASLQRVDATPKSKAVAGAGQCAAAVPTVSDAVRSPGRVSRKKVEQEESDPGSRPVLRRQSLRIQTKQKQKEQLAQRKKELAVERRAELLDVEQNGRAKKRVKVRKRVASETVENGKMAAPKEELKGVAASLGEEKSNASDEKSDYVKVKETLCELLLSGRTKDENGASADGADRLNAAEKSHHAKVKETLRLFNKHYLHFVEEEEKRCRKEAAEGKRTVKISKKFKKGNAFEEDKKQLAKRPDLKAITKMRETKTILNPKRRVGDIPGIKVGHQFYSRAEMVVVGFHNHWLNGIDYMGCAYQADYPKYSFPLAVGIVLSGMYEDDLDNADEIVYTGQGGQNLIGDKRQIQDQKLERGNLALKNCTVHGVPVRVVRGHECVNSYTGRIYTYDGLYKVVKYWADKGISGFTVYKYRLKRVLGQPMLTTNQVQFAYGRVPASVSDLRGLVCDDITGGQEKYAIPASNLVDDPPVPPSGYKYVSFIQVSNNVTLPKAAAGCSCKGTCIDPKTCACARLNGSNFPYVQRDGGRLIEAKDVIYECGPNCGCGPVCINRVSQRGLKYHLEVFRTPRKGWAVRSWDFIPSGAPVCEYIGTLKRLIEAKDVIYECGPNCGCGPVCINRVSQRGLKYHLEVFRTPRKGWAVRSWDFIPSGAPVCEYIGTLKRSEDLESALENNYIFDIDCLQTMKGLGGRVRRSHGMSCQETDQVDSHDDHRYEMPEFCIDAGPSGNIARFINHSCEPNLFVQCVLNSHHDVKLAQVVLFAADNIPPLQELTYDYGYALNSVLGPDGKIKRMPCYCGGSDCRKRLF